MERVKSERLKEYIVDFVASKLNSYRLFTKVYGHKFVKKRLEINLDKAYVQEYNNKNNPGFYDLSDRSITITSPKEEITVSDMLSSGPNEIEREDTMLHEAIHAIFARTKTECEKNNIKRGTGILEQYKNNTELGRGLNEGLTNWICRKAGYMMSSSYVTLREFVDLLELAVGTERIIKLPKGNIKNIAKQLKMTKEEVTELLALADDVYNISPKIKYINHIIQVRERIESLQSEGDSTEEKKQKIADAIGELLCSPLFLDTIRGEEYKEFLKKMGQKDSVKMEKEFFLKELRESQLKYESQINMFKEIVYNKYFKKEVEAIMSMQEISMKDMMKLDKLYALLGISGKEQHSKDIESLGIWNFVNRYEELDSKIFLNAYNRAKELFHQGLLTASEFKKLEQRTNRSRYIINSSFIKEIVELINPMEPQMAYKLLCYLRKEGKLNKISDYSIINLNVGNIQIPVYKKGNKLLGESLKPEYNIEQNDENQESIAIDFTLGLEEDEQKIIQDLLNLRSSILAEDPNATFEIMERLIAISAKDGEKYFYINHGRIVPATIDITSERKINLAQEKAGLPAIQKKSNIFSRISMAIAIRRKFRNESNIIVYYQEARTSKQSSKEKFRSRIADMSSYSNSKQGALEHINEEAIQKPRENIDNEK